MSYNYLTEYDKPAFSPAKDIRCYNLKVDGDLDINPGSINPSDIDPGSENQVLKVTGGVLQYVDQLVNSNIPDPLEVNNIIALASILTPNINTDNITDTTISNGFEGEFLQKSDPGNALVWGPPPAQIFVPGKRIMLSRSAPYMFPTGGGIVAFNTNVSSSGYTLVGNSISVNGTVTEQIKVEFWANIEIVNSTTQYRFDLVTASPSAVLGRCKTPLLQAGATNQYVNVYISWQGDFAPTSTIFVNSTRILGGGASSVDPASGTVNNITCSLIATQV